MRPRANYEKLGPVIWTAPTVTRMDPPYVAGERARLDGWLDYLSGTRCWSNAQD